MPGPASTTLTETNSSCASIDTSTVPPFLYRTDVTIGGVVVIAVVVVIGLLQVGRDIAELV